MTGAKMVSSPQFYYLEVALFVRQCSPLIEGTRFNWGHIWGHAMSTKRNAASKYKASSHQLRFNV
jgi:hypothetical protein